MDLELISERGSIINSSDAILQNIKIVKYCAKDTNQAMTNNPLSVKQFFELDRHNLRSSRAKNIKFKFEYKPKTTKVDHPDQFCLGPASTIVDFLQKSCSYEIFETKQTII